MSTLCICGRWSGPVFLGLASWRTNYSRLFCDATWCHFGIFSFLSSSSALRLQVLWNWSNASKGEDTWSGSLRFFSCSAMAVPSSKITVKRCMLSSKPEIYPCKLFNSFLFSKWSSFTKDPICLPSPKDANLSSWARARRAISVRRNARFPFCWR